MEIFKIIAKKVCHAICHMNYEIVVHHAKMKDDDTFTFMLNDDTEVFIDFWAEKYLIYIDGEFLISENWAPTMTVDAIADDIIDCLKNREI